jgi:hypothetical protein
MLLQCLISLSGAGAPFIQRHAYMIDMTIEADQDINYEGKVFDDTYLVCQHKRTNQLFREPARITISLASEPIQLLLELDVASN